MRERPQRSLKHVEASQTPQPPKESGDVEAESFGKAVEVFRTEHDISRNKLAKQARIPLVTVIRLEEEQADKPRLNTLNKVTDAVRALAPKDDPHAHTIFRLHEDEVQRKTAIEVQSLEAGEQMRVLRGELRESQGKFAQRLEVSEYTLAHFEKGEPSEGGAIIEGIRRLTQEDALSALSERWRKPTERSKEASEGTREGGEHSETNPVVNQWLRVFGGEGMSLVKSTIALHLATGLSKTDFTEKAEKYANHLGDLESGRVTSLHLAPVNAFIEASPLASLGENNKAAQFYRIKTYRDQPMDDQELATCSYGKLEEYLRVATGLTIDELAEKLSQSRTVVYNRATEKRQNIRSVDEEKLIEVLDIHPQSPLAGVIRHKAHFPGEEIPAQMLAGVSDEKYLFAKNVQEAGEYPLTSEK